MSLQLNFYKPELMKGIKRAGNPDTGLSWVLTYEGTEAQMLDICQAYEVAGSNAPLGYGYKTDLQRSAGQKTIATIIIPDDILYTERWTRTTEVISVPIWGSEHLRSQTAYAGLDLTQDSDLRVWLQRIGYLKAGASALSRGLDPNTAVAGANFDAQDRKIMHLVFHSGDYMQVKRPVLRRQRVIPYSSDSRETLVGLETVYRTADLINYFDIPDDVADLIVTVDDNLPAALPDTIWGWKTRVSDQDTVINSAKWFEVLDFVFYRWSTLTHEVFEI